mmetsp:Transcript_34511/g.68545  ORF Transcript_34511/g.68545 Transcript_34511/m.68545 type:complete len:312 (-) Transcript_34511:1426-2361(-)
MVEVGSVTTCTNTTSVTPEVPSRTNSPPYTSASRITPLVTSWGKVNIPPGPTTAPPNTVSRRTRVSAECPALASSDANELPLRKPPYSVDAGGLCSSSLQLLQFTSQPSIPAASQCSPPSDIVNVSVQSTVPSSEVSQEHKRSSYLNTLYVIAGPYWQERMPRSTKSWSGVSHTVMSLTPFSSLHWQKVAYLAHVGSIFLHPSSHSSSAERWRWREERAMAGERNDARSPSLASAAVVASAAAGRVRCARRKCFAAAWELSWERLLAERALASRACLVVAWWPAREELEGLAWVTIPLSTNRSMACSSCTV